MAFTLWALWFFLLGSALGSFYNVLVDRLPEGKDVIWAKSACPGCGTKIRWYDLIPVVSFLILRGRCRSCGVRLSLWYPLSEITVGLLFVLAFARFSQTADAARLFGEICFWSLLFIVGAMDQKFGIILDLFPILTAASGILFSWWYGRGFWDILGGALTGFGSFGLLYLLSRFLLKREGLGLGDVFLLGAMGFWFSWKEILIVAFLSAYLALLFILIAKIRRKTIGWKTEMPLGPSLCLAGFLMTLFRQPILSFLHQILQR